MRCFCLLRSRLPLKAAIVPRSDPQCQNPWAGVDAKNHPRFVLYLPVGGVPQALNRAVLALDREGPGGGKAAPVSDKVFLGE